MHNFRELKVWQKSIEMVKNVYQITRNFPGEEQFGLVQQLRRASVSVPSNIAEGCSRDTEKAFNNFLKMAYGSCSEVITQMIISEELLFVDDNESSTIIIHVEEIQKMLRALINRNKS
ncbi:MAG: four helix bundle protein [Cyclobacteriaceae bacterium]|nr:four helix bundle protein [Cyclobacteriaceae bacterium]